MPDKTRQLRPDSLQDSPWAPPDVRDSYSTQIDAHVAKLGTLIDKTTRKALEIARDRGLNARGKFEAKRKLGREAQESVQRITDSAKARIKSDLEAAMQRAQTPPVGLGPALEDLGVSPNAAQIAQLDAANQIEGIRRALLGMDPTQAKLVIEAAARRADAAVIYAAATTPLDSLLPSDEGARQELLATFWSVRKPEVFARVATIKKAVAHMTANGRTAERAIEKATGIGEAVQAPALS